MNLVTVSGELWPDNLIWISTLFRVCNLLHYTLSDEIHRNPLRAALKQMKIVDFLINVYVITSLNPLELHVHIFLEVLN